MYCDAGGMIIRPATTQTLTQCWYTRTHVPTSQKARGEGGTVISTCRYCQRAIRSHGGKSWTLADGIDLDELAAHSQIRYICVTSVADGMIIARHVIENDLDDAAIRLRCEEISQTHGALEPGSGLDVRLIGGTRH